MPAWKVLLIGLIACVCLALGLATVLSPMVGEGSNRWLWSGGFLAATLVVGWLFSIFLRHAGASMDVKPSWATRH